MNHKQFGNLGEGLAVEFLKTKDYQIVECNFRNKLGELDIIAKHRGVTCFVEVKTRQGVLFGKPYEAITRQKKVRLIRLAQSYLKYRFGTTAIKSRFDVVSIILPVGGSPKIQLISNAFTMDF